MLCICGKGGYLSVLKMLLVAHRIEKNQLSTEAHRGHSLLLQN